MYVCGGYMHLFIWARAHIHMSVQGQMLGSGSFIDCFPPLVSETKTVTDAGAHRLGQAGWSMSSRDLPVSVPLPPPSAGLQRHVTASGFYLTWTPVPVLVSQVLYRLGHLSSPKMYLWMNEWDFICFFKKTQTQVWKYHILECNRNESLYFF